MEKQETLRQFFSYNKNIESEEILDIFLQLDDKLKLIHENGYIIHNLSSDNVVYESGFNFNVASFRKSPSIEMQRANIRDMAKLNLGSQISVATSFADFTAVKTEVIAENYEQMSSSLVPATEGDEYLRAVLVKGADTVYYNDYLRSLRQNQTIDAGGVSRAFSKVKSTEAGRAMSMDDADAAFVNVAFYPIMLGVILVVASVILSLI